MWTQGEKSWKFEAVGYFFWKKRERRMASASFCDKKIKKIDKTSKGIYKDYLRFETD